MDTHDGVIDVWQSAHREVTNAVLLRTRALQCSLSSNLNPYNTVPKS